jgi:tetratricopeptide (TPR) repeat protein
MSESKSALIIANYRYEHPGLGQLVAPAQDADSLARVLADPAIGGFEVRTLVNELSYKVSLEIESFCDNHKRDDLLLLYFSGHGIKDFADNQLYFATVDTQLVQHDVRRATAVSAQFVNEAMNRSRSKRQVLLLDCCYSGAFKDAKGDTRVGAGEQLEGQGRVVLTASDALQYSFEGPQVRGEGIRSVFTRALVHGLETGDADLDRDGYFSLDEVYEYVFERMKEEQPRQKPMMMGFVEGKIFIANNPHPRAADLPPELRESIEDRRPWVRMGAVMELEKLLARGNRGLVLAAQAALDSLASADDSLEVRKAAAKALASYVPPSEHDGFEPERLKDENRDAAEREVLVRTNAEWEEAERERLARAEAERLAAERAEQERIEREKAEEESLTAQKAAAERAAREKAERERLQRERAEAAQRERLAQERAAEERQARERAEQEHRAQQEAEAERRAREEEAKRLAKWQAREEWEARKQAWERRLAQAFVEIKREARRIAEQLQPALPILRKALTNPIALILIAIVGFGLPGAVGAWYFRAYPPPPPLNLRAVLPPADAEVHRSFGDALMKMGNLDEAIAEYSDAVRLLPDNAEARYGLCLALVNKPEPGAAVAECRNAVRLNPGSAQAHNSLGKALESNGGFEAAIVEYGEAVGLDPADPDAHNNLANAHFKLGNSFFENCNLDGAIAEYRAALNLSPNLPGAQQKLNRMLDDKERVRVAIIVGDTYFRNLDYQSAIDKYQEGLGLDPSNTRLHSQLQRAKKALAARN